LIFVGGNDDVCGDEISLPRNRAVDGAGRGFPVHPVYPMCVEARQSAQAGTAHSVSHGVPPGTAELTENFAARGEPRVAGRGPRALSAQPGTTEHSRVPHFRSFARRSSRKRSTRHSRFARSPSPGINPRLTLGSENAYSDIRVSKVLVLDVYGAVTISPATIYKPNVGSEYQNNIFLISRIIYFSSSIYH